MSDLRVTSLRGRKLGTVPTLPDGAVVTGVTTSTSFSGNVTGNVTGNVIGDSNITGTTGTFTGNVSVGGTLTYDDVTDIDSVGVVTARAGIKIGAGQSVSAVSGIVTYYGDGSKLSGVESGVVNFVASGTIANGATVVINTDGTVGIVTITGSTTPSVGSPGTFRSGAQVNNISSTYDSVNGKVVIAYHDDGNSSYGTAIVGTVSGTSISFGTAVVFESGETNFIAIAYDPDQEKVVIAYTDGGDSDKGKSVVGTVSGTSISFGSIVEIGTNFRAFSSTYDTNSNKVVIAFQDNGNSLGKAVVGTVSGTSISFGSIAQFQAASCNEMVSTTFDSSNNKVVIAYLDQGDSNKGRAIVGTVSGTSISFGSEATFNSTATSYISSTYDSTTGKIVIAYRDDNNSNRGTAIVGTVSGTSISFGSEVVFNSGRTDHTSSVYDSANGKVVISYKDLGNSNYGTAIVGTVSGTSISFGTAVLFQSGVVNVSSTTYDSANGKVSIAYQDGSNNYGKAVVFSTTQQTTNLTSENYIGIAAEAISNGATGKINVVAGTNSGQTGLTTAQKYFVQTNGTLSTSAGDPSVVAGTAISGTKIVVR